MKSLTRLPANIGIWLIRNLWQKRIGKRYNERFQILCRFYPTCSEYGALALNKYGIVKGGRLTVQRVKRCTHHNTESCYDYP